MTSTCEHDKKLLGRVLPVSQLDDDIKTSMFELMHQFYFVEQAVFFEDLSNKSTVVLLEDSRGI